MVDLLVTGTDTGIGKTVVAAALVRALRAGKIRVVGWKPVESGVTAAEAPDSAILAQAGGIDEPLARPLLQIHEPLAPAVAAERAGVRLDPAMLEERLGLLRARGYTVVVEGAGGLLVPLAWGYTALDLAARTRLEVVVVARAGLGTLNHVALTVGALRARGVAVFAVVLNGRGEPPDLAEATNPAALARLLPGLAVLVLPREPHADAGEVARRLEPHLRAHLMSAGAIATAGG